VTNSLKRTVDAFVSSVQDCYSAIGQFRQLIEQVRLYRTVVA
jgi:hypothetical protein